MVFSSAGVHDVELHPEFAKNGWIYLSYSEGEQFHSTAVLNRFRLDGTPAVDVERIFKADAYSEDAHHFAARIQFSEGFFYMTIGDRQHPAKAQDNSNHAGTIIRLTDTGAVPQDNPFVNLGEDGRPASRPEIWSYGVRDPMGFQVHPETGELWFHEHGPREGDELKLLKNGAN